MDPKSATPGFAGAGTTRPWKPPIITTVASRQEGIEELWAAVEAHRLHLKSSGQARELAERRLRDETTEVVAELAREHARRSLVEDSALAGRLLKAGTPYRAAEEILNRMRSAPAKRNRGR